MSQQQPVVMGTPQVVYPSIQNQQTMAGQQFFLPAQIQNTNGQTVIIRTVQAPSSGPKVWENYKSRASIWLGGTQITVGLLLILFNIIGLAVGIKDTFTMFMVGHGFWCSPFFLIAGGFGVGAGKHKTTCMIVTTMVMSIISAFVALTAGVSCSATGLAIDRYVLRYTSYQYDYGHYDRDIGNHQDNGGAMKTIMAMHGLMLILALVEFVVAIVASALCCAAVCCGRPMTAFHYGAGAMPPGQPLQTGVQAYTQPQYNTSYPMTPTGQDGASAYMPVGDPILPPSYSETAGGPLETKG